MNLDRTLLHPLPPPHEFAAGVYQLRIVFVNCYFVRINPRHWFLVDTGLPGFAWRVKQVSDILFEGVRPRAIILTHGHFDHAGNADELAQTWSVPIYAHRLELPYLTGRSDYPPKDPTVGGAIGLLSRVMPTHGYDYRHWVRELPENGTIPEMHGWHWIHTPGHTHGHISLFREIDRTLIAGDAFTTVNQDSFVAMTLQHPEFHRAPAPLTSDWSAAERSVRLLATLEPEFVGAGHGEPIVGDRTGRDLMRFASRFDPPSRGRYIPLPARAGAQGVISVPPAVADPFPKVLVGIALAGLAAFYLSRRETQRAGLTR
ncbi:MAG TPA: MBL fold metallo-hydrolase [Bryobacteraceae bacterium]|nr:MBL fold metallo-hydrolase [Bryobacteraceae bacterium]